MQEQLEQETLAVAKKAEHLTEQMVITMIRASLRKLKEGSQKRTSKSFIVPDKFGKTSYGQLKNSGELSNVTITPDNLKGFEPFARKYKIKYAIQKDSATQPPTYYLFFRSRDKEDLKVAFTEYLNKQKQRSKKPSIRKQLSKLISQSQNIHKTLTRSKNQQRSR